MKARNKRKARILLPKGWVEAAGLLKGKKRVHPLRYQKQIRGVWEARLKKLAASR